MNVYIGYYLGLIYANFTLFVISSIEIFNHLRIYVGHIKISYYDVSIYRHFNSCDFWPQSLLKKFTIFINLPAFL